MIINIILKIQKEMKENWLVVGTSYKVFLKNIVLYCVFICFCDTI